MLEDNGNIRNNGVLQSGHNNQRRIARISFITQTTQADLTDEMEEQPLLLKCIRQEANLSKSFAQIDSFL